ncbi:uncharacterized protein IL334_002628 [Kwoniella shivajii]|uniref:Uncharacterized protein n=1 Tax=Kwoniella shivajii TaxID=564305 RepID=A0ABZ1CVW9_9TREE|nr:hypothetical protein IL334_002628 [Kwoniella shivajii]
MVLHWFLRGPPSSRIKKRGGSGSGITTTRPCPPISTETKWRGIGSEPKIAGSTGGFIGLISGIVIVLIILTFVGIYLRNRYRKRLPSKRTHNNPNPLPSLSFSRPSTDPYAQSSTQRQFQPEMDMELETDNEMEMDIGDTPKASKFNFTRPVYTRQRSSDWELPIDNPNNYIGKGKGKGRVDVKLPNEPSEVALPLRSKSPRPVSPSSTPRSRSNSANSISSTTSTPIRNDCKGRSGTLEVGPGPNLQTHGSIINPFENPYDETRLGPIPFGRQGSMSSFDSAESDGDGPEDRTRRFTNETPEGSSGGDDSDRSVRVSQIREGTRFVERFESKESLA